MIKNIAYFPLQCAQNAPPVIKAFQQGCRQHSIDMVIDSMTADAAVIWSVLWNGRMKLNEAVYQHYRAQGKPVICIDVGALHRGVTWKIAVNNINAQGYYGHQLNLDHDRPRRLGIALHTVKKVKSAVLIALQHPRSLQVQDIDQVSWARQQIINIRKVSDLPVLIRSHPRGRLDLGSLTNLATVQPARPVQGTYDSFDIDYSYQVVVNYNSGVGIQAGLSGAKVCVDQTSLAHPISIALQNLDRDQSMDRQQWLIEICHTEYLLEEIAQGTWLKRIAHKLES